MHYLRKASPTTPALLSPRPNHPLEDKTDRTFANVPSRRPIKEKASCAVCIRQQPAGTSPTPLQDTGEPRVLCEEEDEVPERDEQRPKRKEAGVEPFLTAV